MKSLILKGIFPLILVSLVFVEDGVIRAASSPPSSPVVVPVTIRHNRFETTVERVSPKTPLLFRVTNKGKSLEEFESYDMAFEVVVRPGQTVEIPVSGLGPGTYEYFGDFHPRTARGTITVK